LSIVTTKVTVEIGFMSYLPCRRLQSRSYYLHVVVWCARPPVFLTCTTWVCLTLHYYYTA